SVGVYSSPHLIRYNERVRINGQDLPDVEHSRAFAHIDQQRGDTSLSFFEFGTLAALYLFKQHQVDVVLLEVGLGGRLDATNVVEHDVSVITSLAVDHVDWLGDDINVIGFEKAGIFRSGKPAVCGQPKAPATVAGHADDIGAQLHQVGIQYDYSLES
ncbi:bifunctional tetrahydrofolate synthase/dihydrofolate synthase, partial [Vibrio campbellii]